MKNIMFTLLSTMIILTISCQEKAEVPHGELFLKTNPIIMSGANANVKFGYRGNGFYYTLQTGMKVQRTTQDGRKFMDNESIALPYHNPDKDTSFVIFNYNATFKGADTTYRAKLIVTNVADNGNDVAVFESSEIQVVVKK